MQDIDNVVSVHLASFSGYFLSFLGPRFLSLYYSGICSSPEGIAFIYTSDDLIPVGFVVGASNPRGFYSRLLKRDWLRFSFASVRAVIRKPTAFARIVRAFSHPSQYPVGESTAGLFSVAVTPSFQKKGIGEKLVLRFLEDAEQRGCKQSLLTTDRDNNNEVNLFYVKLGFKIERQYVTDEGRRMNEYRKINSSQSSEP